MHVIGDARSITLFNETIEKGITPVIQSVPLVDGHNLYWFDAEVTTVEEVHTSISTIYTVDYDTMHK